MPQMRNLYEVNKEMIKPACALDRVSYVEHIVRRQRTPAVGREVEVFVSHWWGEEFPKFMRALDRYARVRSASQASWRRAVFIVCLVFVVAPMIISGVVSALGLEDTLHTDRQFNPASVLNMLIVMATPVVLVLTHKPKLDPMETSFWICAFANNQFAVGHAIGENGDVMTSSFASALQASACKQVAVILDSEITIYRRVWCAFEFFFAKVLLPQKMSKHMEISMIDEHGVVSDGDASRPTIRGLRKAIKDVKIAEASSSRPEDKSNIFGFIESEQACTEDLDEQLRHFAKMGLNAANVRRRAPAAVLFLGPLGSVNVVYGLRSVLKMGSDGCDFDSCPDHTVIQLGTIFLGLALMAALFLFIVPKPLLTVQGKHTCSAHTRRVLGRAGLAIAVFVVPGVLLEVTCWIMMSPFGSTYGLGKMHIMCWDVMHVTTGLAALAAFAYLGTRDMERFAPVRRYVEDAFLA